MIKHQPSAFLHTPNQGSYHPLATPPSQTEDAGVRYAPRETACLTVRRDERVLLNAEAARQLPDGLEAVELLHPVRDRDRWRLTTQAGARCRLSAVNGGGYCFRAPLATRTLFAGQPPEVQVLRFGLQHVGNGVYWLHSLTVNN